MRRLLAFFLKQLFLFDNDLEFEWEFDLGRGADSSFARNRFFTVILNVLDSYLLAILSVSPFGSTFGWIPSRRLPPFRMNTAANTVSLASLFITRQRCESLNIYHMSPNRSPAPPKSSSGGASTLGSSFFVSFLTSFFSSLTGAFSAFPAAAGAAPPTEPTLPSPFLMSYIMMC